MKKWLLLLIVILSSFSAYSQEESRAIPVSILTSIIDELIVKDGLVYELSVKDSIISVYEHKDSLNQIKLKEYKLSIEQYKSVQNNLNELLVISEAEKQDLKRELRKVRFKHGVMMLGEAIIIVLLIL